MEGHYLLIALKAISYSNKLISVQIQLKTEDQFLLNIRKVL
jgi:hypothetical protein